jgi:TonB-linked SusC/RagA family outer membrane protein
MRKLLCLLLGVLLTVTQLLAQNRTITGTVRDNNGNPLANASVQVKGTNIGTVTNASGVYTLSVPSNARTIVISSVGQTAQEMTIGTQSDISVTLQAADRNLQEVVVTALGVRREKRSLGYSVSELKGEDITKTPNQNVVNSLSGKVAGVQVISSGGAPGMGSRVVIRGGNKSLAGNNEPLFVVDGIPVSNANDGNSNTVTGAGTPNRVGDINPEDIESVSILKGSAASVLYGNRGANGVVLITTKSGKTRGGKPVITLSSTYGTDNALKLPDVQTAFAQGQLVSGVPTYAEGTSLSFGPRITGQTVTSTGAGGPVTLTVHDPRKEFLQTGHTYNNNLSFAQSNERGNYFLSIGNSKQTSIVPNQEYNKANLRFNVTSNLTSKLTAGANLNYVRSWGDVPYTGQDGNNPIFALFNMPVTWDVMGYGYQNANGTQKNFRGGSFDNPLWTVNKTFYNTVADRFIGGVNFGYKVLPWINLSYKLGGDLMTDYRKGFRDINTGANPNGRLSNDNVFRQEISSTLLANIDRRINDDIGFTLAVGQDFNHRTFREIFQSASALTLPGIAHMSNGKAYDPDFESISKRAMIGAFADLRLDFKNYLFLGITGRNEWSSTLPEDNRRYFYPGANVSFVFTDALKISNDILNYGKIRAGYAKTARDAGVYQIYDIYTASSFGDGFTTGITFPFGAIPGFTVSNSIRNPYLKPETTKEFETGAELRFLKNRINLDFTYFRNTNENGIVNVDISPATGATGAVVNSGAIKSNGIEIGLSATPVKLKNFTWDVSMTFSRIRSKVIETYPGVERISLGGFSGNPAIFAIKGERYGSIVGTKLRRDSLGNVIISATTGRPLFDDGLNLGYVEPDWTGGLRNAFSFKNFTFDFLIDTRQGGFMMNGTEDLIDGYGVSKKTETREQDFIYPGVKSTDKSVNDKVVKRDQNWWSSAKVNEEYIYENNWTKLREVNLGYSFALNNSKSLKNVNIGIYGRNLYLWSKIPHVDPESSSFGTGNAQGVTRMAFPTTRSLGVNLKLTF